MIYVTGDTHASFTLREGVFSPKDMTKNDYVSFAATLAAYGTIRRSRPMRWTG